MALAASSADPETLRALDTAADAAAARGAPAAAAELVELAIGLGGDQPERRIHAAEHHFNAGDAERARALLEETLDKLPSGHAARNRAQPDGRSTPLRRQLDRSRRCSRARARRRRGQPGLAGADPDRACIRPTNDREVRRVVGQCTQGGDTRRATRRSGPHQQSARDVGPVELHVRTRGRRDQSATGAWSWKIPTSTCSPRSAPAWIEASGAGLDRAAGRGPGAEWRRCTADAPSAAPRTTSWPSPAASTLIEIWRGNFVEAARLADEAMERAEQGGGITGHRPFHAGDGGRLPWARTAMRAPMPRPPWTSRGEVRHRASPSGPS